MKELIPSNPKDRGYQFDLLKHSHSRTGFKQVIKVYKAEQPNLAPKKGLYFNERY